VAQRIRSLISVLIGIRLPADADAIHHDRYEQHRVDGKSGFVFNRAQSQARWAARDTGLSDNDALPRLKRFL